MSDDAPAVELARGSPLLEGIQLWDGAQTRSIGPPLAERLGIDASGTRLVVAVRGELSAWQVATGARLWTASLPAAMSHIAWSGDVVVALGVDRIVRIVDRGVAIELPARGPVDKISVGASAGIATVSGAVVELWAATGARLGEIRGTSPVTAATFSPDAGRIAIAGDSGILRLHDATTGAALGELVGHRGGISSIEFTADGARLATAGYDLLGAVAFSPDDRTLLSGCNDHTTRVWDLASSRELARLTTSGTPGSIEFAGAGARIVTGTSDRIARIWDAATRQLVRSFEHSSAVEYATLTADGSLLAAGTRDGSPRSCAATRRTG